MNTMTRHHITIFGHKYALPVQNRKSETSGLITIFNCLSRVKFSHSSVLRFLSMNDK